VESGRDLVAKVVAEVDEDVAAQDEVEILGVGGG
jgi:hypothetical protein